MINIGLLSILSAYLVAVSHKLWMSPQPFKSMIPCFSSMNLSFSISRDSSLTWILPGSPRLSMPPATFTHCEGRTYNFSRECLFANGVGGIRLTMWLKVWFRNQTVSLRASRARLFAWKRTACAPFNCSSSEATPCCYVRGSVLKGWY